MGIGITILAALAIGAAAVLVIVLACLTVKKLKQLIKERLEKKRKSKVAFGSTRKVINEHAREILSQAPSMKMAELEKMADDSPYFIVDYDARTGKESDFAMIQAESAETRVEDLFRENDGIVLFD